MVVKKQLHLWILIIPMNSRYSMIIWSTLITEICITTTCMLYSGIRAEYANSFIIYLGTKSIFMDVLNKKFVPHSKKLFCKWKKNYCLLFFFIIIIIIFDYPEELWRSSKKHYNVKILSNTLSSPDPGSL